MIDMQQQLERSAIKKEFVANDLKPNKALTSASRGSATVAKWDATMGMANGENSARNE